MSYNSLNKEERQEITILFIQKLTKYIATNKSKINIEENQRIRIDKDFIQIILSDLVSLYSNILEFIDLDGVSFAGIDIRNKDLSNTKADINPQTVYDKDLAGANLSGLDMSDKDFTDVCLVCTNLSYTNADIDPQLVYNKNLSGTNLTRLDMSDKDFTDVCIIDTNLSYTKANVDPHMILNKDLTGTNLTGCTIIGRMTSDIKISSETVLKDVTYEDDYEKAKQYIKSLFN